MIFIVTEQILNGTVTIGTSVFAIEADNFSEAKEILNKTLADKFHDVELVSKDDHVRYVIPAPILNVSGTMYQTPLVIIRKNNALDSVTNANVN